jgi:hypothetical protein
MQNLLKKTPAFSDLQGAPFFRKFAIRKGAISLSKND